MAALENQEVPNLTRTFVEPSANTRHFEIGYNPGAIADRPPQKSSLR